MIVELARKGEFEIDADGRIWRVAKRGGNPLRGSFAVRPCPRVRAEYRQRQGYLLVCSTVANKRHAALAHRVAWTFFNGPIPSGMTINHRNGDKADNRPANLELATMSEQRQHAVRVLNVPRNRPKGSLHPKTRLTEADVMTIRKMRGDGVMVKEIAAKFKMRTRAVSAICTRRTWTHI